MCPAVLESDAETYIIIGKTLNLSGEDPLRNRVGDGETAIEISAEMLEAERDAALNQWRLEVERIRYEAERAERRYRAVEPENREQ